METFGDKIRVAREQSSLYLRHVAAELDIDQAIISKFERGERKPTRDQVLKFAEFFMLDKDELLVAWLSDKVAYEIGDENLACEALKVAERKIKDVQKSKTYKMQLQTVNERNNTINRTVTQSKEYFGEMFFEGVKLMKNWKPKRINLEGQIDVLDFFSGCGGMSLGFAAMSQKTNLFKIIGGLDLSEFALKSFEKNYNVKTLRKDIREIYLNKEQQQIKDYFGIKDKRKRPLVIIGCAPCQGFSAHQKRYGQINDERNTLIGSFAEVVISFDPDYIVMENVPEILGEKYSQHYNEAKEIFESKGYKISQSIFNSAGFGVPQARYRAVIVASKSNFSLPLELFSPNEYATVKDAIGDLPKVNAGEIFKGDPYHKSAAHKKSTIETISKVPKNGGNRPKGVGPKCLDKVSGFSDVYGRLSWDKPSITITQYSRNPASGRFTHPIQNRGLTIREAARIQSFPDGFEFVGNLDECFKQIGEAVPPLLSLAIATQIAIDISANENGIAVKTKNEYGFNDKQNLSVPLNLKTKKAVIA